MFEGENDRVKLLTLYCGDEGEDGDPLLVRAAAGALAVLSHSEKVCKKIIEVRVIYLVNRYIIMEIMIKEYRSATINRKIVTRHLSSHTVFFGP